MERRYIAPNAVSTGDQLNLDSVERVSIATLVERLGRLSDQRVRQVGTALAVAVDCS